MLQIEASTNIQTMESILNDTEIQIILDAQGETTYNTSLQDKGRLIDIITRHVLIDAPRSLIEEIKNGLKTLGVLDNIVKYPEKFRDMFTSENIEPLDAQSVDLLFQVSYAEKGSNTRDGQERTIVFWRDYLQDCESE